jgi:hypothetical protein
MVTWVGAVTCPGATCANSSQRSVGFSTMPVTSQERPSACQVPPARGLARSARPHHRHHRPGVDGQVNAGQRVHLGGSLAVGPGHLSHVEDAHRGPPVLCRSFMVGPVFLVVTAGWHGHRAVAAGPSGAVLPCYPARSSSRWRAISCSGYACIDVGPSSGDPWRPVSQPSGRAWGKVTAWVFFRRRDHWHGRAPWPGPHRGPAGRAGGPPASGARAGPSAGGYGTAARCLISSAGHPILWEPVADSPALVGPALRGTVRIRVAMARHPKVPAGWNIAARRSVTRRC